MQRTEYMCIHLHVQSLVEYMRVIHYISQEGCFLAMHHLLIEYEFILSDGKYIAK